MLRALWTAATGLNAQQRNVDVTANNLANVNTTGFKRQRASFHDLFYARLKEPGTRAGAAGGYIPGGIQVGHGVFNVGTPLKVLIVADIDAGATTGNTIGFELSDQNAITVLPSGTVIADSFPHGSSNAIIGKTLSIAGTDAAPVQVTPGQTGVLMEAIAWGAQPANPWRASARGAGPGRGCRGSAPVDCVSDLLGPSVVGIDSEARKRPETWANCGPL